MGVCRQSIERGSPVHSVLWLPGNEAFMSVEGTRIVKLDLTGKVLDTYHFERLEIHDVCITPDGQRLLGFGTLVSSGAGLKPCKCRAEKQIIVYNLDRRIIETHVPLLHTIRDITLSRSGQFALISHEQKVPPQLWKLVAFYDWERVDPIQAITLSLRHTYIPKTAVDFAGSSSFGGRDDELVLCAGKAGDIHIWDRESASYLHHIPPPALGGDMTCIAWNPAADPFMFASGSHDGRCRSGQPQGCLQAIQVRVLLPSHRLQKHPSRPLNQLNQGLRVCTPLVRSYENAVSNTHPRSSMIPLISRKNMAD